MRLQALCERRSLAERLLGMILDLTQGDVFARTPAGEIAQDFPLQRSLRGNHVPSDPDAAITVDLQDGKRGGDHPPGIRKS